MLPVIILSAVCQMWVKSTYSKYSKIMNARRMTGAQAAFYVMRNTEADGVKIESVGGTLTDNYNPSTDTVNLSVDVHSTPSIASVGIAAHEAGHAIQHHSGYSLIKLRALLVPVCNLGSSAAPLLILLGILLDMAGLYMLGIFGFCTIALFQLVTLPVEFNASKRAMRSLEECGILNDDELKGARKVLTAAAMTYVAALATSVMQIFYYTSVFNRRRK